MQEKSALEFFFANASSWREKRSYHIIIISLTLTAEGRYGIWCRENLQTTTGKRQLTKVIWERDN